MALSKTFEVVILLFSMLVAPKLLIVTSPLILTLVAKLLEPPTIIFALSNAEPIVETPEIVVFETLVILPLASTVNIGDCVAAP